MMYIVFCSRTSREGSFFSSDSAARKSRLQTAGRRQTSRACDCAILLIYFNTFSSARGDAVVGLVTVVPGGGPRQSHGQRRAAAH